MPDTLAEKDAAFLKEWKGIERAIAVAIENNDLDALRNLRKQESALTFAQTLVRMRDSVRLLLASDPVTLSAEHAHWALDILGRHSDDAAQILTRIDDIAATWRSHQIQRDVDRWKAYIAAGLPPEVAVALCVASVTSNSGHLTAIAEVARQIAPLVTSFLGEEGE